MLTEDSGEGLSPQYLAGVIDSDGSLSLVKRRETRRPTKVGFQIRAIFSLTWENKPVCRAVMEKISKQYGCKFWEIRTSGYQGYGGDRNALKLSMEGNALRAFIQDTLPYLQIKRRQAEIIRDWFEMRYKDGKRVSFGKNGWPLETWAQMVSMSEELTSLNTKNRKVVAWD